MNQLLFLEPPPFKKFKTKNYWDKIELAGMIAKGKGVITCIYHTKKYGKEYVFIQDTQGNPEVKESPILAEYEMEKGFVSETLGEMLKKYEDDEEDDEE